MNKLRVLVLSFPDFTDQNQVRVWQSISYPINNNSAMTKLGLLVLSFPDFTDISSKSARPQWTSTHKDTTKDE